MPFQKKMDLNISEIVKVVPIFDGSPKDLDNFLNLIKLYSDQLKVAEQSKLIALILSVKLSNCVRSKISLEETPDTFKKFKEILNKVFSSKKSALEIQSELFKAKQTGSIENFISKIESLVDELNIVQKKNLIDADAKTIHQLSDQLALNAFKNGLLEKLKPTVLASRPKNLLEATETAREAAKVIEVDITHQMSHLRNFNQYRNYDNGNRFNRFNPHVRGHFDNRRKIHNSNYKNQGFRNHGPVQNNKVYNQQNFKQEYIPRYPGGYANRGNSYLRGNYTKGNHRINVIQHSGNELAPLVTSEEEVVTKIGSMRID